MTNGEVNVYAWTKRKPLRLKPTTPEAEKRFYEHRKREMEERRKCAEHNASIIDGLGEPEMERLRKMMRGR
jgi:hypothetical protein